MPEAFDLSQSTVLERFLRYVQIHTSSIDDVENAYPSSARQLELGRLLLGELAALGLSDAAMDGYGYVTATLPANVDPAEACRIPVIAFIAHLDTYPAVSGENVRPILHPGYDGSDIALPGDPDQVIRVEENKELRDFLGDTLVTSDGTTLLGADDKAGVAEIMAALEYLTAHPEVRHGTIRIGFTPDEEVGNGTKYFDVQKFGAQFAYTMDGGYPGEVESETFCADSAIVRITGKDVHPGYAKGKMINAVRVAADFIGQFPPDTLPETTAERQGYLHPYQVEGNVSAAKITILLRDFAVEGLNEKKRLLEEMMAGTCDRFPGARIELEVKESYRNMIYKIQEDPRVVDYAVEAVQRVGLKPIMRAIRGGTDGARLSFMGLPTPNIFAGGMNFHSKQEWVALSAMKQAVGTILHLVQVWREKSL